MVSSSVSACHLAPLKASSVFHYNVLFSVCFILQLDHSQPSFMSFQHTEFNFARIIII